MIHRVKRIFSPLHQQIKKSVSFSKRQLVLFLSAVLIAISTITLSYTPTASAATPATVSADPLPTVQIDGIVWKQAISGNTVFAVGQFNTARPAGVARGGAGTVTRSSFLAYDIRTGELISQYVYNLTGAAAMGKSVAVSPDGKRLYIGGDFTHVNGQPRSNFAAINLETNTLLSGSEGTNKRISAVAATNSKVYVGGTFSKAGGLDRMRLAAYDRDGKIDSKWKADVTGFRVSALVATKTQGNLVIAGHMTGINGQPYYGSGAVKLDTGKNVPWGSQKKSYAITMQPNDPDKASQLAITSLSADATQVYLTAFTSMGGIKPGTFEGRAAISPTDGKIIWINDCVGDTYDAVPIGKVLYSVGHAHKCSVIGGFPQQTAQRALAETTYKTGTNIGNNGGTYAQYDGKPSGSLLNWFPALNTGTVSGAYQAAWSVIGNSNYIALGGEFTKAGSMKQEGLVRYTIKSNAPNKQGPYDYVGQYHAAGDQGFKLAVAAHPANAEGKSTVRVYSTGDPDDEQLTYTLYRKGSTTPLASKTMFSQFWKTSSWAYTDSGIAPGKSLNYSLEVKDPSGNKIWIEDATFMNDNDKRITYGSRKGVSDWTFSSNRDPKFPDLSASIRYATRDGAAYRFKFEGTSVRIVSQTGPNRGVMKVSVDGGAYQVVDLSVGKTAFQQIVFTATDLAPGSHMIRVEKVSGTKLYLDGFIVR